MTTKRVRAAQIQMKSKDRMQLFRMLANKYGATIISNGEAEQGPPVASFVLGDRSFAHISSLAGGTGAEDNEQVMGRVYVRLSSRRAERMAEALIRAFPEKQLLIFNGADGKVLHIGMNLDKEFNVPDDVESMIMDARALGHWLDLGERAPDEIKIALRIVSIISMSGVAGLQADMSGKLVEAITAIRNAEPLVEVYELISDRRAPYSSLLDAQRELGRVVEKLGDHEPW